VIGSDLDSEIFKRFNIENRGHRVGYVNYHVEADDVLFIDDLRLDAKAMRPPWFFIPLPYGTGSFPPERWRVTATNSSMDSMQYFDVPDWNHLFFRLQ